MVDLDVLNKTGVDLDVVADVEVPQETVVSGDVDGIDLSQVGRIRLTIKEAEDE